MQSDTQMRSNEYSNRDSERDSITYDHLRAVLGLPAKYTRKPQPTSGPVLHWSMTTAGYRVTAIWYGKRDVVHRESTFGTSLREAWLSMAARGVIPPAVVRDESKWRTFVMLGR
jgi:hypothetical protein